VTDENVAAFPQPKPTIVEILTEFGKTDQPEMEMMMRIKEHHPKATKAEFEAAMAAAMQAVGGPKLQEAAIPQPEPLFVPVAHVVDRIVNETLDAIGPSEPGEARRLKTWTDVAVAIINRHPSHTNLVSWLAMQGLEDALCSAASERDLDLDYVMDFGSPEIEATEADEKHSQVMQAEFEEVRRRIAKRS
jgi:hypothetical protein